MAKKRGQKFCPRCGTPNDIRDAYCIKCGYSFIKKKGKKLDIRKILIILIIFSIIWVIIRFLLNSSIIPNELIDIFKNITSNSTG